ncbi:MAG: hypothetical protein P4N59_22220, partial [Negativicutes bacterium]|nr:hypothetical protein [Negativicutes bacterium]
NRVGRGLQALTGRVVEFDPKGGRSHFLILMVTTMAWHQLAERVALAGSRCNRVQPFFCRKKRRQIRNYFPVGFQRLQLAGFRRSKVFPALKRGGKASENTQNSIGATYFGKMGCTLFGLLNSILSGSATSYVL